MIDWLNLAQTLVTFGAGGSIMAIINRKTNKRNEVAKARQEEAAADAGEFENLKNIYKGDIEDLRKQVAKLEWRDADKARQIYGMQRFLTVTTAQKRYAEFHVCTKLDCDKRVPPIGTFKTEDFDYKKCEEGEENEQGIEQ